MNCRRLRLLLLVCFSLSVSAFGSGPTVTADDACSPKDFRKDLGEIRDQGELGWCYAFATADLISQRIHHKVSGLDVAMAYSLYDSRALLESRSGSIQNFLQENPQIRTALENRMDNDGPLGDSGVLARLFEVTNENPDLSFKKVATAKGLAQQGGDASIAALLYNLNGYCPEKNYPSTDENAALLLKKAYQNVAKQEEASKSCIGESIQDPASIFTDSRAWHVMTEYRRMVDQRCQRQALPVTLIPVYAGAESLQTFEESYPRGSASRKSFQDDLLKKMNAFLDHDRAVAIDYSAYLLVPRESGETDDGDHTSVIVGRKKIRGTCHYLLRNSYGSDCSQYRREFRGRCERGHVWVTKEELRKAPLVGVTSLQ